MKLLRELERLPSSPMPQKIVPMKATLVEAPFSREGWLFEVKWDGVRTIVYKKNEDVKLISRNQRDLSDIFPELKDELAKLTVKRTIIDGEIVSLDQKGRPSFEQLQARVNVSSPSFELQKRVPVYFYAFDLLYLEGKDLRKEPLIKRKQLLAEILRLNHLRYSDHVLADGNKFFDQIRKYNLEGMIAKDCSSKYEEKRSFKWLKIKAYQSQEAVVGGWLESEKGRKFASLALGVYEGDRLLFIGSVGTGFSQEDFKSLFDILSALEIEKSPFVGRQPAGKIHWVLPKLVVQVKFVEWTKSGILRQPIFQGIRYDKNPKEVHREIGIRLRHRR